VREAAAVVPTGSRISMARIIPRPRARVVQS
jgi:hypothetical protein